MPNTRVETSAATAPNKCWSMDFVSDTFGAGRSFRALTIVDTFMRECPAIEGDSSLTRARVAAVLDGLKRGSVLAKRIKVDNVLPWTSSIAFGHRSTIAP